MTLDEALRQAITHHQSGQRQKAAELYHSILNTDKNQPDANHLLGLIAQHQGDSQRAIALISHAIQHAPNQAQYYASLGQSYAHTGQWQSAEQSYQQSLRLNPNASITHYNLGNLYLAMGKPNAAIAAYTQAIQHNPSHSDAYNNMGSAHNSQKHHQAAIECYQTALNIHPQHAEAAFNLGTVYEESGQAQHALHAYQTAYQTNPNNLDIRTALCHQAQYFAEWPAVAALTDGINTHLHDAQQHSNVTLGIPFAWLSMTDDLRTHQRVAQQKIHRLKQNLVHTTPYQHAPPVHANRIINLGYVSSDFKNHATAHLILGIFRCHDPQKFRLHCYAYNHDDGSDYRQKIMALSGQFSDVSALTDAAIADKIYADNIDILIDLKGHTRQNRLGICARRPAPIQITYLGFPGTTGADFFDYILCDHIVLPPEHVAFYTEKPLYLPHTYQATDDQQNISQQRYTRAQFGLPEQHFIFCSFNQMYKIDAEKFSLWMALLNQVKHSILWLLSAHPVAQANLQRAATQHGIAPERLIFAPVLPKPEHLKRLQLADLVLDTDLYNGHTTTTDALWAGIPVVTLQGQQFAARVSASVLTALNMPELITHSPAAYQTLALTLATTPHYLANIKAKLARHRLSAPLFNTLQQTRALEALYQQVAQPPSAATLTHQANGLLAHNQIDAAKTLYLQTLRLYPEQPETHYNLGNAHEQLGDTANAIACYQRAIQLQPDFAQAHNNLGNAFKAQQRWAAAMACYQHAVRITPQYAEAHFNLGSTYETLTQTEQAFTHYALAHEYHPQNVDISTALCHQAQHLAKWSSVKTLTQSIITQLKTAQRPAQASLGIPFAFFCITDDLALNHMVAERCAQNIQRTALKQHPAYSHTGQTHPHKPLKIGYLSGDFFDHATTHLILGLFQHHDHHQFDIHCYAYGPDDGSDYRRTIMAMSDHFTSVDSHTDAQIAERIYADQIDLLIDLKGHTQHNRLGICALRPAPVQATYLGYPGTSGANFFDYLICDAIVAPPSHAPYYTEKLVYLPNTYLATDNQQTISTSTQHRSQYGLPDNYFVFCSFNQAYKIDEATFKLWMQILHQVKHSVLWLDAGHPIAQANFQQAAKTSGIAPERLIFAQKKPKPEHLKRLQLADLALDTRLCNGHTTSVDALWAGLPVLTQGGQHFASNVSSSLLTAIELTELITHSAEAYVQLATDLALNPKRLTNIRQQLATKRQNTALFDTQTHTQHLEAIYQKLVKQGLKNQG